MILTFFYVIATSIQSRRILFLKAHLRNLFNGSATSYPSIMFFSKTPLDSYKEPKSPVDEQEGGEEFMTCCLCTNKNNARLGELLWYHNDMRLCTIYPQQKIDISNWLTYQYGKALFPLCTNNRNGMLFRESEYKMYVLVEADLESYKPIAATNAIKIEDYGLIITWTANKNINLILETDLDTVAKFLIAAMEGQCYVNNGLLLRRVETVLISGKPCIYNNDLLNPPPDKKIVGQIEWEAHVEKLRILSNTAKLASEQHKPLEVEEFPEVTIYPENTATDEEVELMQRAASKETLESGSRSHVSTPVSVCLSRQLDNLADSVTHHVDADSLSLQSPSSTFGSKSLDTLDNIENASDNKNTRKQSSADVKNTSKSLDQDAFRGMKEDPPIRPKAPIKSSMTEITEKLASKNIKPPNILIYADSVIALNNVKNVLGESLGIDKYAIYTLTTDEARTDAWMENAALVIVCGNVTGEIGSQIIEYIVRGGKLLALCSDVLHILLPSFKTAEVRENELVHFSYGKWKHVRMMHHIFCYQASPIRTRFSQENEDVKVTGLSPPTSTNVKDRRGNLHSFNVNVLGTEETWHTPSILLASLPESSGKVVFSQIHLEVDPMQYEFEESKFNALKESNTARVEIFNDLLNVHLGIKTHSGPQINVSAKYTPAFFLGRHELKLEMLERLKGIMQSSDTLKMINLEIQFCRSGANVRPASYSFLPIMMHQCPDNFSTIEYFENLTSKELGRLVIYTDVISSTRNVLYGSNLQHGLAVIAREQTQGRGRGKNIWLSPKGCAMFSLQLHIPTNSVLGNHISIVQHMVSTAVVSAVRNLPGYEEIDLRLKWPNDIYAGNNIKIGGVSVDTYVISGLNICNVGVGVNLHNKEPTCCINELIKMYNETYRKNLKIISYEQYFAIVFNEVERWLDLIQSGNNNALLEAYYNYWIHTDTDVTVVSTSGISQTAKILGIDDYGFLRVRGEDGEIFTVHPDGNSFDCLQGLIVPK